MFYLVYPSQTSANKKGFNHLEFEVFEDKDKCRERARVVDMFPGTEWVVIEGKLIGMGIDESLDLFEDKK